MAEPVTPTPTQPEALDPAAEPAKKTLEAIEVSVGKGSSLIKDNMPLHAKLTHLVALVVTSIIALFVAAVLCDGRSVVYLKPVDKLPRLTSPYYIKYGLDYRADELLGPTYGVGLHHDASGFTWTEAGAKQSLQTYINELGFLQTIAAVPSVIATDGLKHPVHFLSCDRLKATAQSAMGLGFIAEIVAALMIIFHGCALLGVLSGLVRAKVAKVLGVLVWFTITAGFLIVIGLALGIMDTTWNCKNDFIPEIKLSDHFYFTYGLGFGYTGYVCANLVLMMICVFTSTEDGKKAAVPMPNMKAAVGKIVGGVFVGMLVVMTVSLSVAGSQGAFDDDGVDKSNGFTSGKYAVSTKEGGSGGNPCYKQKPYDAGPGDQYFVNVECAKDGIIQVLEQAGANITKGFVGGMDAGTWRVPITEPYHATDLCPVNVHWHLGAEHLSLGQFDGEGSGPAGDGGDSHDDDKYNERRRLGGKGGNSTVRLGFQCHHYKEELDRSLFDDFDFKECEQMLVGETYEVHWPHSAAGMCGSEWQYQTPFYDGVFCKDGVINILTPLNTYENIGVQGQVFTIVNSDAPEYQYDNLFEGMIVDGNPGTEKLNKGFGVDMAYYTGSTTGTTRDNFKCSRYSPITRQVDRTCHMISAQSFEKMCKKMKLNRDDMSSDLHPHGARQLVNKTLTANNQGSTNHADYN